MGREEALVPTIDGLARRYLRPRHVHPYKGCRVTGRSSGRLWNGFRRPGRRQLIKDGRSSPSATQFQSAFACGTPDRTVEAHHSCPNDASHQSRSTRRPIPTLIGGSGLNQPSSSWRTAQTEFESDQARANPRAHLPTRSLRRAIRLHRPLSWGNPSFGSSSQSNRSSARLLCAKLPAYPCLLLLQTDAPRQLEAAYASAEYTHRGYPC